MNLKFTNKWDNTQVINPLKGSRSDLLSQIRRKTPITDDVNARSTHQTTPSHTTVKTRSTKTYTRDQRDKTSALIINKHRKQTKEKRGTTVTSGKATPINAGATIGVIKPSQKEG